MGRIKSSRMTSSRRHKIERKKREAKRDIRKAAKALKDAGQGNVRKKKMREAAKSALRISKASARKEEVLNRLLQVRETLKAQKSANKKGSAVKAAIALDRKRDRAGGKLPTLDDDFEDEEGSEFDDEEEEFDEDEKEDDEEEEEEEEVVEEDPNKVRQLKRLLIPNKVGASYKEQFRIFVDVCGFPSATGMSEIQTGLPLAILVTLDARCAVQSMPWGELDYILAQSEAAIAQGTKKPLVLFALCKADTVSASAIAAQYKLLSDALADRYLDETALEQAKAAGQTPKGRSSGRKSQKQEAPAVETSSLFPVEFAFCPFSSEVDGTSRQILKVLRSYGDSLFAEKVADKESLPHNMFRKLAVLVLGLPKTGKSTLTHALCVSGSENSVAVAPVKGLSLMQHVGGDQPSRTRILVPSPKSITLVTLPDDYSYNRKSIISGDVIFMNEKLVDKLENPESVATVLLEELGEKTLPAVAQNFSVAFNAPVEDDEDEADGGDDSKKKVSPLARAGIRVLKSLGRTIVRERGFLPSVYAAATDETSNGTLGGAAEISASKIKDAAFTAISGRRIVRVWPEKKDGRNALRVGSRLFLKEFSSGKHFPWAVLTSTNTQPLNVYNYDCVFTNAYLGAKDIAAAAGAPSAGTGKAAAAAATFQPGLAAIQKAMTAYMVLLPKYSIPISPDAIITNRVDFSAAEPVSESDDSDAEDDDEGEEDFDDEEEEEGSEMFDDEEEEFEEDEEEESDFSQ